MNRVFPGTGTVKRRLVQDRADNDTDVWKCGVFTHSMDKGGSFMGKGNNSQKKETKKPPKDAKAGKAKPAAK